MKKCSRFLCERAQHTVKYGACTGERHFSQTGISDSKGHAILKLGPRLFAPEPCLTLSGLVLLGRPSTGCSTHNPDYQRRSFSTKGRSITYYYDILGVSPKANQAEIKSAYYKLSKVHHPDLNKKGESDMITEINEAYEILGNIKKRRMYDNGILFRNEPRGTDDHDYTQSFRQQEGFRTERKAPPTGRTSQYYFDEFYRQHYGNTIRHQKAGREYVRQMNEQEKLSRAEYQLKKLITCSLLFSMLVMLLIKSLTPDDGRPKHTLRGKKSNSPKD